MHEVTFWNQEEAISRSARQVVEELKGREENHGPARVHNSLAELSRVIQRPGETANLFIAWFKKMQNHCKILLLENEYVKMA
ncbi:conserved hypothetical protein [Ricinus communis]|uniref:Uncharacterized protein n=1 Tax=Ricinus communis TaxID=3988 RepID=B9SAB5_RICCO|nr:conserved hypothetical protein [Ricinus communis]